jgi:hypothetical protein
MKAYLSLSGHTFPVYRELGVSDQRNLGVSD